MLIGDVAVARFALALGVDQDEVGGSPCTRQVIPFGVLRFAMAIGSRSAR
jgi:hypothetical protein